MSLLVEQLLPQLPFSNTGTCFSVGGKCGIENQYKFLPQNLASANQHLFIGL